jgi:glucose/arabinose dehydrogenase
MGHRNPQGLFFDKEDNFILETEHGPQGGDEINLIEIDKLDKDKIQNYGWAISSDGEHYPGGKSDEELKETYEKYPLYKSHTEYGFIKPLKSFVPSIAISEIVKISEKKYVVASMKDKSLYFFEINEKRQVLDLKRVEVYERIRDLRFHGENNQLYLFMEDTASIGLINLN